MTRKLLPCVLFAAFLAASAAFAEAPAINNVGLEPGTIYDALLGGKLVVDLQSAGAKYVYADWTLDNTNVRLYLDGEGTDWSCQLPPCHTGLVSVVVTTEDEQGNKQSYMQQDFRVYENTTEPQGLSNQRYPDLMEWGTSTLDENWSGNGFIHDANRPQMITIRGTSTEETPTATGAASGGSIRTVSELKGGLGSIFLKAKMTVTNVSDGTLVLERIPYTISERTGRTIYSTPEEITRISIPVATGNYEWHQFHLILQDDTEMVVYRFRNKTLADSDADRANKAIDICDIVLTPLIPDVAIYKDEADYSPGYPSILDPIEFHISVSNLYASAPATNFTPVLFWRQKSGVDWDDWTPTLMTNRLGRTHTGDGTYACVLTDADITDGAFEYFYEVGFTGYTPTFPYLKFPDHGSYNNVVNDRFGWGVSYLIHTNALALLMDDQGNINEGRSPAYYPDFKVKYQEDSIKNGPFANYARSFDIVPGSVADTSGSWWDFTRKFDLRYLNLGWPDGEANWTDYIPVGAKTKIRPGEIEIPATYEYLKFLAPDGIRRFRSLYNGLAAVTRDLTPTNARPEFLDFSYPMQHVGDYVWQAIIPMSGAIDHYFSVTGAMAHAEGATAYDPGPFEWIQLDQRDTDINPPMNGDMAGRSHLRRFQAYPTNIVSTVWFTTNYTLYTPVQTTGLYVGLVTNELEEGAEPTIDDVVYWLRRLEVKYDRATETFSTNLAATVEENYRVVPNPDLADDGVSGTEFEVVYRTWFAPTINDVDNGRGTARFVTNETTVVESITDKRITKKMSGPVTRTVWEPSDEDLEAEGEAEWAAYHPGEGAFPGWSALRTRVQIDYSGFLMFRFCTTNGSYQIRRAAWQDFNTWQADNAKFSRSFGIYDMKTFESDLAGRDLTEFADNLDFSTLDDDGLVPATTGWSDASTNLYWNGFAGTGLRIAKDRTPAKKGSKTRNTAIWLNTHPTRQGPGHLETTLAQRGAGGRGTLEMRVRSASDDDRVATYVGDGTAGTWHDYRVVARILAGQTEPADISEGEHSISLIGYYQNRGNFWEARIVQKSRIQDQEKGLLRNWFELHIYEWKNGRCYEHFGKISHKWANGRPGYDGDDNGTTGYQVPSTGAGPLATWPGRKYQATNNSSYGNDNGYWGNNGSDASRGIFLSNYQGDDLGGWVFSFDLKTVGNTVTPVLWGWRAKDIKDGAETEVYYKYEISPVATPVNQGRPGYNMRDCGIRIGAYVFDNSGETPEAINFTTGSSASAYKALSSSSADKWERSDDWSYDMDQMVDVWEGGIKNGATAIGTNPTTLHRPAPKVWYGVQVYRTQAEETADFMAPIGKYVNGEYAQWDDGWDAYHGNKRKDGAQCVQSYAWQPIEIPMSLWDETFLAIAALPDNGVPPEDSRYSQSCGVLAVDDLACDDWRGVTVYDADYSETAAPERNQTDSFVATYAAIASDPRDRYGRVYELNRSRANPRKSQGIDTPLLIRGVGDILFSYRVEDDPDKGHPVDVAVQVVNETGTRATDLFVTNLMVGAAGTLYVPCLSNITGRLRIVARTPDTANEGELGTVYVDNIRATDYPVTGDTSWEVYNALVSSFPDRRALKFDGTSEAASAYRSTVLNDGIRKDTLQDHTFDEHVPFVQTPSIETGVGEVSFWYRASPDNGSNQAKITLMVADTSKRPDGEWRELTAEDLSWDDKLYPGNPQDDPNWQAQAAQLEALKHIDTSRWTYFNVEFYQKDFRVLRIVSGAPETTPETLASIAPNRVMLDNVLITEPVRTSIDVGAIDFLPSIPLSTKPTGAKVTLVNPRMGPENIQVFLDWYVSAPDAELEPFPIRTITIDSYEKAIPMYTNIVIEGESIRVSWTRYQTIATTNETVEITRLPEAMKNAGTRKWGYEEWKDCPSGTLTFTNAPNDAYTFYSTGTIPTDLFKADTMFQYCVRVTYTGKFQSPVYSETQGRVRNGFWFDNPPWYEPIDLNTAFDTKEQPVAHAFVFSCTTNVVFFNEFRPWLGINNHQDIQFVELMGPAGAKIGGWSIEHFGPRNGVLPQNYVFYTNILASGAAFVDANNATTNKGWGTYVLGCSGIPGAQEPLFPPEAESSWETTDMRAHPFLNIPGAMRLRRSMGAYVDKIVWGPHSDITDVEKLMGFTWASTMGYDQAFNTESYVHYVFNREGEFDTLVWRTTGSSTIGGYNRDEENVLPWLDGTEEKPKILPELEVAFSGFSFETAPDGSVDLRFRVRTLNDVALEADSGYDWDVEASGNLAGWISLVERGQAEFLDEAITASDDGAWSGEFTVRVPATQDVRFFRIRATAAE